MPADSDQDMENVIQDLADTNMADADLPDLDHRARANYDMVTRYFKSTLITMPDVLTMYYQPHAATIPNVPMSLQPAVLFRNWDAIADANGTALQDATTQHLTVARLIWYYGLDSQHNFARLFASTRYNIMLMAYAWACDFPEELCSPASSARLFIMGYLTAWIESLMDGPDVAENTFEARNKFIALWRDSEWDMITFRPAQRQVFGKHLKKALAKPEPKEILHQIEEDPTALIERVRSGEISSEDFMDSGPFLVLRWIKGMSDIGEWHAEATHKKLKQLQAGIQEGIYKARMAEKFTSCSLAEVKWTGDLVAPLTMPLKQMSGVKYGTQRKPWMDASKAIDIIIENGKDLMEAMEAMQLDE